MGEHGDPGLLFLNTGMLISIVAFPVRAVLVAQAHASPSAFSRLSRLSGCPARLRHANAPGISVHNQHVLPASSSHLAASSKPIYF
jgi:hypothetical protein